MEKEEYESKETKCHGCGRNEFRLTRMTEQEVLAECTHCGYAHTLDSVRGDKKRFTLLYWYTTPKVKERCEECRTSLKVYDINVQTGRARAQCENCGLLYLYKKDRLRGWHVIRITRRVQTPQPHEKKPRRK